MKSSITKAKKAQIITFDFSTSLIVFLLFIAVFIGLFLLSQGIEKKQEFELEYVFANLENNLQYNATQNRDFFRDYRVNEEKLNSFASAITSTGSIDEYVVGTIGAAHGIGLDAAAYDVCLYLTDNNNQLISLGGATALGMVKSGSCASVIASVASTDPCSSYKQTISIFKPVLFDEGSPTNNNRIVQMNLVICKK